MSEFSASDFDGLHINVYQTPKGKDLLKIFPELKLHAAFTKVMAEGLNRNDVIRYVVYVYDKESPYRKKYKDVNTRKIHCALEAGFSLNENNEFSASIERMINGGDEKVNDMIVEYVKMHYDVKYSYVVMMEAIYYDNLIKAMVDGTAMGKISDLKQVQEELEKAQKELLAQDNNRGLIKALYGKIDSDRLELSPEDIARKIKDRGYAGAISTD
jgi:hypothetical protein